MLNLQITMQQPKIHSKFLHECLEMMYIFYDLKKGLPLCVKQTVCSLYDYLTDDFDIVEMQLLVSIITV